MILVRNVSLLVWLTILWMLLWRSASAANLIGGLLIGGLVLAFTHRSSRGADDRDHSIRINPLASAYLLMFVLYKLVEANAVLAWEIVTPKNRINTGIVAVPLRTESEMAMMVVANLITLTPGTVTIDAATIDASDPATVEGSSGGSGGPRPVLYVHVLHLHDVERVRADLMHLEALTVRAFGSSAARRQLAQGSDS